MVSLPGGLENAEHLSNCTQLIDILKSRKSEGKWISAICASPYVVFNKHGLLEGEKATCYPSMTLDDPSEAEKRVVVSNNVITSRAPGNFFSLTIYLRNCY